MGYTIDFDNDPFLDFGGHQFPTLPRKIYTHFIPVNPAQVSCCQLKASAVSPRQLKAGTRYTIKGVWGCSAPYQRDVDLMVSISVDGWETHVVNGRDLL